MMTAKTSENVNFVRASEELNLYKMPFISALRTMLICAKAFDIPIYFNDEVYGYKIGDPLEETSNDDGDITKIRTLKKSYFFDISNRLRASSDADCFWVDGQYFITMSSFNHNNTDYHITDETQEWLSFQSFNINGFYFDRKDLKSLSRKIDTNKPPSNNSIHRRPDSNAGLQQQKRELVFKAWLRVMANLNEAGDSDNISDCYELIGSPTRAAVWEALKNINSDLFNSGKDDFFKNQCVIMFSVGTGSDRGKIKRLK